MFSSIVSSEKFAQLSNETVYVSRANSGRIEVLVRTDSLGIYSSLKFVGEGSTVVYWLVSNVAYWSGQSNIEEPTITFFFLSSSQIALELRKKSIVKTNHPFSRDINSHKVKSVGYKKRDILFSPRKNEFS